MVQHQLDSATSFRTKRSGVFPQFTWGVQIQALLAMVLATPLLLPGIIVPQTWQPFLVAGLLPLLPFHLLTQRPASPLDRVNTASLIALLLWLPTNLLISVNYVDSWISCGYLLFGIVLYGILIKHPILRQRPLLFQYGFVVLAAAISFAMPPLVRWKSAFRLFYVPVYDWLAAIPIDTGETIHANLLAGAIVLMLPYTLAYLLVPTTRVRIRLPHQENRKSISQRSHKKRAKQIWCWFTILLSTFMLGLLIITQSRGGYLGFTCAVIALLLLRWPRLRYLIPVGIIAVMMIGRQIGVWSIFDQLGADNTFGGGEWRLSIWMSSQQALQDFLFTGIGIGSFQEVMPFLYPNPAIKSSAATHAHNLLLQIGLDLGLIGLFAWLTFFCTICIMLLKILHRTSSPNYSANQVGAKWVDDHFKAPEHVGVSISRKRFTRELFKLEQTRQRQWALAAGCLTALIGMQVHGLLDAVTWNNKLAFIPWLLFAQVTILYREVSRQSQPDSTLLTQIN